MFHEFSSEQKVAVESDSPKLVVRASAGAGKTRVLVATYVRQVVENSLSPDQILAITFTRKAAAEMKARIVGQLRNLGRSRDAQIAETGPIQTIHAFCERVLRENSLAAGIDPDFEILDGSLQAKWCKECLNAQLAKSESSSAYAREFLRQTAGTSSFQARTAHGNLEKLLADGWSLLRESQFGPDFFLEKHGEALSLITDWHQLVLDDCRAAGLTLSVMPEQSDFWLALANELKSTKQAAPFPHPSISSAPTAIEIEAHSAEWTCGLVEFVAHAWKEYDLRLDQEQKFDFRALEHKTVQLLRSHPAVGDRIRRQYQMILLDESQDMSPLQHELVETMGIGRELSVGDPKQSIYGFRQADSRLFDEKAIRHTTTELTANYRSKDGILATVDLMFGSIWSEYRSMRTESGPADFSCVDILQTDSKSDQAIVLWMAQIIERESPERVKILVRKHAAGAKYAQMLEELGIPVRNHGGSQLFYTRLVVRDLANLLELATGKTDDLTALSVLRGPGVGLTLNSCVEIAIQKPIFPNLSLIELSDLSEQEKLTSFLQWLQQARSEGRRWSAFEMLQSLVTRTPLMENLASSSNALQNVANARKLIRMAADRPLQSPQTFAQEIRAIQELRHSEDDASSLNDELPAVDIMTIHRSKGLEFPVVILPDTYQKLHGIARNVELSRQTGLVAVQVRDRINANRDWIAGQRKRREKEEEFRLLYVAMTRAKERLCLVGQDRSNENILAAAIWNQLNPTPERMPGVRLSKQSSYSLPPPETTSE